MKIPRIALLAVAALLLGIAAAGCGGSSSSSSAPAGTNASSGSSGGYGYGGGGSGSSASAVTIKATSSPLGTILVDQDGKTLYLFEADSQNKSNCSGGCLSLWPPVDGKATAGSGVTAWMVGTATGSSQVTYAGHPLYWFSGDTAAGDTNGEGLTDFGGAWYAVSPTGKAVEEAGS
jgi:predicted lipoprotein with Yx(FWY)xxD motif